MKSERLLLVAIFLTQFGISEIAAQTNLAAIGSLALPSTHPGPFPTIRMGLQVEFQNFFYIGAGGGAASNEWYTWFASGMGSSHVMCYGAIGLKYDKLSVFYEFSAMAARYRDSVALRDQNLILGNVNMIGTQFVHGIGIAGEMQENIFMFAGIGFLQSRSEGYNYQFKTEYAANVDYVAKWRDFQSSSESFFHQYLDQYKVQLGISARIRLL